MKRSCWTPTSAVQELVVRRAKQEGKTVEQWMSEAITEKLRGPLDCLPATNYEGLRYRQDLQQPAHSPEAWASTRLRKEVPESEELSYPGYAKYGLETIKKAAAMSLAGIQSRKIRHETGVQVGTFYSLRKWLAVPGNLEKLGELPIVATSQHVVQPSAGEQLTDAVLLYDAGKSIAEVGRQLGMSISFVQFQLRQAGRKICVGARHRAQFVPTPEQIATIKALYSDGLSIFAIHKQTGISDNWLRKNCKAIGCVRSESYNGQRQRSTAQPPMPANAPLPPALAYTPPKPEPREEGQTSCKELACPYPLTLDSCYCRMHKQMFESTTSILSSSLSARALRDVQP